MSSWPVVELREVAEVSSGDGAPQDAAVFGGTGTPFIRAGSLALLLDGTTEAQLELIPETEAQKRRMRTYPAHTVVFAKSGMSCTKGLIYELKGPAHIVNHLAALECGRELHSRFLLRWLQINSPARLIANPSYPSIRISDIRSDVILLPPLAEQKRIAAMLDAAEDLRAKRRESIKLLDALVESVFFEMFGDPATNPMSWRRRKLGEATLIEAPMVDPTEAEYRQLLHYGPDRIEPNTGELLPAVTAEEDELISGKFLCSPGEVLYSKIRPYLNKVAIVRDVCLCSADVYPIRPDASALTKEYLAVLLRSRAFLDYAAGFSRRANIPKLNRKQFAGYPAPLPPLDLQRRFAAVFDSIERQKDLMRTHLAELDTLFASLQQRAFNGEL